MLSKGGADKMLSKGGADWADWADLFFHLLPCEPVVFHQQVEFTGSFIEAKCKLVKKYK